MKFVFTVFVKFLVYLIYFCILEVNCNNIIGCGGFIKTDLKNFSFSRLSAHLLFVDGTLNYVTDILPNGAYSIPIYDFGNYIVKVVGPEGWSIEPESGHRLEVNSQESCSDDYNFSFAGFSIFGKVSTAYISHGPPGIFIYLLNNSQIISQTITIDGGNFTINKVFPGNYSLHFKSETSDGKIVELNDTKYNLEINNDNLYIKDSFIIYGYPVIGDVKFFEEPIKDVEFFIFSKTITATNFNFSRYKCISFNKDIFDINEYDALCKTISDYNGEFIFPLLPGGKYLIVPKYNTEVSTYDLHPENFSFEIKSSSIDLRSTFKIIGFSVIGKVITFNGDPIFNAEIYVDDCLLTKTDIDGNFSLKGVKNGSHNISISLKGYTFNNTMVNFNPKNPNIGIFYPSKISICGSVFIQNFKSNEKELNEFSTRRKILLINATSGDIVDHIYTELQNSDKVISVDNTMISTFCFFSKPGLYIVKPILESSITTHSLAPSKIKILLDSIPVTVKFSPFRGSISGIVKCLRKCSAGEFEVTLNLKEEIVDSLQLTQHVSVADELTNEGYFHFKDVVPGAYQIELISTNNHISLLNNRWCWSQTILNVNIVDKDVNGLVFEQIGYSLPIQSSHDLKINYFLNKSATLMESKNLSKGLSQICLSDSGKYEIQVETCYKLENSTYFVNSHEICGSHFDFHNPTCHLKINVVEFKVRVDFEIMKITDKVDLQAHVKGILDIDLNSQLQNIRWENNKGYIDFWVKSDINVDISVNSSRYLIKPKTIFLKLSKNTSSCLTKIGTFKLESGTFINGSVVPPIEGVFVEIRQTVLTLNDDDIEYTVASSKTNENGHFSFGPLNSSYKYELKLSKNGYKIVKNLDSENNFHFKAYKLAELIVQVLDVNGKTLSGILLSIIGNDLRKNELTNEDGQYIFVGLTPGVYYLRAMMKELEFSPSGAIEVVIVEGSTENILIKATRTSFSLHGKVVSLNGEPESGVTVEGDPIKYLENVQSNCKFNLVRNEHATTDETGIFRIRGLQPGCYYRLSIKKIDMHENYAIIRSYPKQMIVKMEDKDVYNIKIFALRNLNIREISAMVWTTSEIFQSSLHLLVFPSDNPENIITAHKYNNEGIFFQMNLPQNHKRTEYVVRLQSNLSPSMYSNISAQEKTLTIESGETKSVHKHFEFHFHPVKKLLGESDIATTLSSSLILPLLIILVSILFFQKDLLEPSIKKVFKILKYSLHTYKQTNLTLPPSGAIKSNIFDTMEISELNDVIAKPKFTASISHAKKTFWSKTKKA